MKEPIFYVVFFIYLMSVMFGGFLIINGILKVNIVSITIGLFLLIPSIINLISFVHNFINVEIDYNRKQLKMNNRRKRKNDK